MLDIVVKLLSNQYTEMPTTEARRCWIAGSDLLIANIHLQLLQG